MVVAFHMASQGTIEMAHMKGRCAQSMRRVIHPPPPTTCRLPSTNLLLSDGDTAAGGESSAAMLKHELNIFASVRRFSVLLLEWTGWSIPKWLILFL